ncbi:MAG TPA: ABC transporter ATP-binding protein [Planctomycetes bacterium]|nr:ABC transporter ATP-binding protein [Planctomycetaceae bacterium]HIM30746.1 ABC transporter ATP-binding protein [Planctomycetota bacterium]
MSPNASPALPRLTIKGLYQELDKVTVLRDVTFELRAGERLALLGPTGGGKTTLLRSIAGLDVPTAGDISLGDRSISNLPPHQRRLSFVFQDRILYPHLTVRENLSLATPPAGSRTIPIARVTELLHITHFLDRRPDQLSGGEQQRVAIARALAASPQVLCLDEPFNNLDTAAKAALRHTLLELHDEFPATWILVTHDPTDAMLMGQRTAVLERGKLLQLDTTANLRLDPNHYRVAQLMDDPPTNIVRRRATIVEAGWLVDGVSLPNGWSPNSSEKERDVLICFRPEDARIAAGPVDAHSASLILPLLVRSIIRTQGQKRIDGLIDGTPVSLLMREFPDRVTNAQNVSLCVAASKLLFFETESGQRIR